MIPKHPKVKTLQRNNEDFISLVPYHNAHPDNGYLIKRRHTLLEKKIKQTKKMIRSDPSYRLTYQKCSCLCLGIKIMSIFTYGHTQAGVRQGGPLSYDTTSILRCFVTRTQTQARTYSPTNFCIMSKNRVQKGSKWKTIHVSILRLLQNERRLYVENVSHRLTVEQGHFVWRSRRGRPGYSVGIYLWSHQVIMSWGMPDIQSRVSQIYHRRSVMAD